MKTRNLIMFSCIVAIASSGYSFVQGQQYNANVFLKENVEALCVEGPEVGITCGENDGPCWHPNDSEGYAVEPCRFTGFMSNSCYKN